MYCTVSQQWLVTPAAAGKVVKLRGWKGGGSGSSAIGVNTTISAILVQASSGGGGGGGGAVTSVFGRTGAVNAQSGDYASYYVPLSRQVSTGAGLSGGGALAGDLTLTANVVSVFGRTGAINASSTDYSSFYPPISRQIATGTGLQGGGDLSLDRTLSVVNDSTTQKVEVANNGGPAVGTRKQICFIPGTNISYTIADNSAANRVDVTINSTTPGGMSDPTTTLGDLIVRGSAAPPTRLGVTANNNWVLTSDSAQTLGMKWAAVANSVFGRTGAVTAQSGDYTAAQVGAVPTTTQVIAGTGLTGGGPLSGSVTLNSVALAASGPTHSAGFAPDPGSSAGTTRFLREDASWQVPPTGSGGMADPTTTKGDLIVRGTSAPPTRLGVGSNNQVLVADNTVASVGIKWAATPVMVASGASHASGAAPDPGATAGTTHYLREDASWQIPPYPATMVASGASHAPGLTPDTPSTAGSTKYLREDATWQAPPYPAVMAASGASHAAGLAPDPGSTAATTHYLREDASWQIPPYPAVMVASGASHAVGLVPDPGSTAGSAKFLREDASWQTPTAAQVGAVPTSTQVIAGSGLSGGGPLSANVTLSAPVMVASGASHAAGIAPDPGATAGTTRFLREDASWQNPQTPWASDIDAASHALKNVSTLSIGISSTGSPLIVHEGVNQNVIFSSFGGVTAINAYNDAVSATVQLDFIASSFYFGSNVGFQQTTPKNAIHVNGNGFFQSSSAPPDPGDGSGAGLRLGFYGSGNYGYVLANNTGVAGLSLVFQPSGGNVGIGATSPTHLLELNVDSAAKPTSNTWTIFSDARLKQKVKPLEGGLAVINRIKPVEGEYNGLHNTPKGQRVVSVVVEDIREFLPDCVPFHKGKLREEDAEETVILDFNSHKILFHLILAVQQLAKKN